MLKFDWVGYSNDGCLNCVTLKQAENMIKVLDRRFKQCGLELNLSKTKIIYCKEKGRDKEYENIRFDLLGYTFRPREAINGKGQEFTGFLPPEFDHFYCQSQDYINIYI